MLKDHQLCKEITEALVAQLKEIKIDVVTGIESRGFLFGLALAQALNVPFVPIRKVGKLPYKTIQQSYDLEYGSATLEVHEDAFTPGQNVLIHDDLLATGGSAGAAAELIQKCGGQVAGFSFLVGLNFLDGEDKLKNYSGNICTLARYF